MVTSVQLVECPRDAMQGWPHLIPTEKKVAYLNSLLAVGFHTIDFGSFVSPKAIPQMADTSDVLKGLRLENTESKLLAIVANTRGAQEAVSYDEISYLGFPFSISETFQQRNTNSSIAESLGRVEEIQNLCLKNNKQLVVYLSMGFDNPYGDEYNEEILLKWADEMVKRNITIISLADTVGLASGEQISFALNTLIPKYPGTTIGVHLHSTPTNWREKLDAAVNAGCTRIDGALKGIGGCPMAGNDLIGNMNTENIIVYLREKNLLPAINNTALENSLQLASEIFV
ncbi:MAG: hydroxymethylglutaryl-CoA lyase [Chitinophagaceae bacterium]|nr:MAG: hydroxymethylglutaryl-CoA lyase [Chitinophagaceae bacterium]